MNPEGNGKGKVEVSVISHLRLMPRKPPRVHTLTILSWREQGARQSGEPVPQLPLLQAVL